MEPALPDVQHDDELRYATEHFADLQGLRTAPFWAALVLFCALEYALAMSRVQALEAFLLMLLPGGVWFAYAGRWYRHHYGLVIPRDRSASPVLSIMQTGRRSAVAAGWNAVAVLLFVLFSVPLLLHKFAGRNTAFGLLIILFLLPKAFSSGGVSRSVRGRRLLAMGGIVVIGVLHFTFLLARLDQWQYLGGTATVLLLVSLYDHWLLAHLLSGSGGKDRNA